MQDLHFMEELLGLGVFIALVAAIYYADIALGVWKERKAERKAQADWAESLREHRNRRELFRSRGVSEHQNPYAGPSSR